MVAATHKTELLKEVDGTQIQYEAFMSVEGERSRGVNVLAVKAIRSPLARLTKHLATHPRGVTDLRAFKITRDGSSDRR
jgi:hypothetical protein